jgi:hypothetical protein
MGYGMLGYVVPIPFILQGIIAIQKILPFMGLASQKNSINLYHMGIYADPKLYKWFTEAHTKASPKN